MRSGVCVCPNDTYLPDRRPCRPSPSLSHKLGLIKNFGTGPPPTGLGDRAAPPGVSFGAGGSCGRQTGLGWSAVFSRNPLPLRIGRGYIRCWFASPTDEVTFDLLASPGPTDPLARRPSAPLPNRGGTCPPCTRPFA